MLTKIGGKTLGCFDIASESDWPDSTSLPICVMITRSAGLSVCWPRIDRHFVSERPAPIIVANWREKMVMSLILTPVPKVIEFSEASRPPGCSRLTMT